MVSIIIAIYGIQFHSPGTFQKTMFVESLTTTGGIFVVTLRYFFDTTGSETITRYTKIGLSVFLVDSEFSSPNNYVYAKTSDLENIEDGDDYGQFDFETGSDNDSPFDYVTIKQVCGTEGTGNDLRLHTSCSLNNFYVFVTGYRVDNSQDTDPTIDLRAVLVQNDQVPGITLTPNIDDSSSTSYIYKQDSDDLSVGLWVHYQSNSGVGTYQLLQLQVSFIFIGVRFFDASQYPMQNAINRDTFTAFSIQNNA